MMKLKHLAIAAVALSMTAAAYADKSADTIDGRSDTRKAQKKAVKRADAGLVTANVPAGHGDKVPTVNDSLQPQDTEAARAQGGTDLRATATVPQPAANAPAGYGDKAPTANSQLQPQDTQAAQPKSGTGMDATVGTSRQPPANAPAGYGDKSPAGNGQLKPQDTQAAQAQSNTQDSGRK